MKKIIIILLGLIIVGSVLTWQFKNAEAPAGNPETQNSGNAAEKAGLIVLETPRPGEVITSPLLVKGRARGNWYFEASFPVVLLAGDGSVLAEHYASAEGDWMTENFVPFSSTLSFTVPPNTKGGTLILKRDNPSGLPENEDQLVVPVSFR
jgi:hypothetical protein